MSTKAWHDFECGIIAEEECYSLIADLLSVPHDDIADTIKGAKISLRPDDKMLSILKDIKNMSQGELKIHLMSNISQPHWDYVRSMEAPWHIFDQIFTSAGAHMRKPDLCFYKHVLESIGLTKSPSSVLFIDDKLENVCSAQAVGMKGLAFDNADNVVQQVRNMLGEPVARGTKYLKGNAKQLRTICNTPTLCDIDMKENFAQLLILENTGDKSLVELKDYHMLWNFFQDKPILTTIEFPNDYDTTSLALTILNGYHPPSVINQILNASLANQSPDHLPLVYDDPTRPRFDPVVCVHIYTLFHLSRRGHELRPTWEYICNFLDFRAYEQGTYYYAPPEYFLYALARLISYARKRKTPLPTLPKHLASHTKHKTTTLLDLLKIRCHERINTAPSNAMSLALRMVACRVTGIPPADLEADANRLKALQEPDGSWPWCEIYRAPGAKAAIGSRGVVTSFAVKALEMIDGDKDDYNNGYVAASKRSLRSAVRVWGLWALPVVLRRAISLVSSVTANAVPAGFRAKGHLV